jgi:hypothetical protein
MGDSEADRNPAADPEAPLYSGEPLETEGGVRVPRQQPVGEQALEGGGEYPDPATPPRLPAPGAVDDPAGSEE